MVNIKDVRKSIAELEARPVGPTALFVGATSGIGKSTLINFAKHVNKGTVYILTRSNATTFLETLKSINPEGNFKLIQGQTSLVKDVDAACSEIISKEHSLDLLFLSAGALSLAGRDDTAEGLDTNFAVSYYSRIRFMTNLLPLLSKATSPRIVSILAAGQEGKINMDDLELKYHYSLPNEAVHTGTMMSLSMDELAKENPSVSFVHVYPGFVNTDILSKMFAGMTGLWAVLGYLGSFLMPVLRLISMSVEEAGERGLYVATSERYDASKSTGNFYRLDAVGENVKDNPVYDKYIKDGVGKDVLQHTTDVFDRISVRD